MWHDAKPLVLWGNSGRKSPRLISFRAYDSSDFKLMSYETKLL